MRIGDLFIGLLLLAGGAVLALAARAYPNLPNQAYGAATFPFFIGLGLAGLGVLMVAGGLRANGLRIGAPVVFEDWGRSRGSWLRLGAVIGLVLAYVWLSPVAGFLPAAGVLLLGLMLVFRTPLWLAVLVSVPAVFAFAQVFGGLLRVPLPRSAWTVGLW